LEVALVNEINSGLHDSRHEESSDEISILDLLLVIAAGKKLIITLAFVCGIAAGVIAFTTPDTFKATATILPPQQQSSSASAIIGQLGGLAGSAGNARSSQNAVYIGILESRAVANELVKQLGLQEWYKTEKLSSARSRLKSASEFKSSNSGMIDISVKDRDPQRAADIANAYVRILKARNDELAITEASQRRVFFEEKWEEEKNNLTKAEWELKSFQEQRGIINVGGQTEAVLQSIMRLRADITAVELNLARLRAGATSQNHEVQRQEAALTKLRADLQQLQQLNKQNAGNGRNDFLLSASMMPDAGLEYARRLREVKYREALYEAMARQYESARLDEARESWVKVLDDAIPPDRRSAPNRRLYVLVGLISGGMMGVFIVFLRHAANDPSQADKVAELKNLLSFGLLRK